MDRRQLGLSDAIGRGIQGRLRIGDGQLIGSDFGIVHRDGVGAAGR